MRFYKVTVSGSFLPDAPSTRSLGAVGSEFLEIHADDFFGDVTGDWLAEHHQQLLRLMEQLDKQNMLRKEK